jgi:hypothetical protein
MIELERQKSVFNVIIKPIIFVVIGVGVIGVSTALIIIYCRRWRKRKQNP